MALRQQLKQGLLPDVEQPLREALRAVDDALAQGERRGRRSAGVALAREDAEFIGQLKLLHAILADYLPPPTGLA